MPRSGLSRAETRAIRLIKCLRLLEGNCYSLGDLAARFQVSRRTIYRDLRLLNKADVPLMRRTADGLYHVPAAPDEAMSTAPEM